ncbi:LOW QUALITY PROTEIN: kinectin [Bombina bombina]|uniref:LOW QUALITY PROTEIN: kinectin n=1 Tax=Bombina bombina TaxID=8345 RepID=UPI00235B16CA|nr:LOW QUALITY PROTEIN: kinectin [Bombina bombina]
MEFYESTYFIVLVPAVVITVIFLFFWLFMKETSYDEVLAKQKKDLKPPPAKIDKKKIDKKKNKKKESHNGNTHESDSETTIREFDLGDALSVEEEHVVPSVTGTDTMANIRERKKKEKKPPKVATEEQISKEVNGTKFSGKKVESVPVTKQPSPPLDTPGTKKKTGQKKAKNGQDDSPISPDLKHEQVVPSPKKQEPIPVAVEHKQQETGTGKKKSAAKKQKIENVSAVVDEPLIHPTTYIPLMDKSEINLEKKEIVNLEKSEVTEGLQKTGNKKAKNVTDRENAEVKFKDVLGSMKNLNFTEEEAMSVLGLLKEKSGAVHNIIQKANKNDSAAALHQLQEKEKLLVAARDSTATVKEQCKQLSQELLAEKQKSNLIEAKARERINTLEKENTTYQGKMHNSFQENQQMQLKFQQVREKLETQLNHLKQENGILRDAVSSATNQMENKQSSELNKLRQDYARLMNELTENNNKVAQEELQKKNSEQALVQLKAQMQDAKRRSEEIEAYLRKRTTDYETAQQDLQAKLMSKESEVQSLHSKLTDTIVNNQQLEQRIMQLMDAGHDEGLQMQVQELLKQNEALNVQIQKYHSQITAQSQASVLVEEMQKTIAEKEKQIKQTEESLAQEHASNANNAEEFKFLQRDNLSLKTELNKLQGVKNEQASASHALEELQKSIIEKDETIRTLNERLQQVSNQVDDYKVLHNNHKELQFEVEKLQSLLMEQANKDLLGQMQKSNQEKDEKIKTVEELLEAGLIEVANKQEELKHLKEENASLRIEFQSLQVQQTEQISLSSVVEDLKNKVHEKEGKIKSVEQHLQAEILRADNQEKKVQALNLEIESLKKALANSQLEKAEQVSVLSRVQELQNELKGKEETLKTIEATFNESERTIADKQRRIQELEQEVSALKVHTDQVQQNSSSLQLEELQNLLKKQEEELKNALAKLSEREEEVAHKTRELQDLKNEREILKVQAWELQQKHDQQMQQISAAAQSEELLKALAEKDTNITNLHNELESLKSAVEQQRTKNNDLREKNWKAMEALTSTEKMLQERIHKTAKEKEQLIHAVEAETRTVLQKLFPSVSVSASLRHCEWVQQFEKLAQECLSDSAGLENVKAMEQNLKEGTEINVLLQQECEKYKSVLAETEGILQRLQRSVEEEEGRWKVKVEESQKELNEALSKVFTLEQELERFRTGKHNSITMQKVKDHLETELEKAENERASYVSEVRELKDLLTELQRKLDDSYSEAIRQNEELTLLKRQLNETLTNWKESRCERQKVANDLHEAQKSLDIIQLEILKAAGGCYCHRK